MITRVLTIGLIMTSSLVYAESPQTIKSNEEAVRLEMLAISKQIGVTCTECHNPNNFREDLKKSYKIGLSHIKITNILREHGFDGKRGPEATCFMCHQGKLKPNYLQKK